MATQFAKVDLSQIISSLFPPPPKHVLQKQPPDTVISYGRQVMLHQPSKQLQRQAFQYLVEHLSEQLKSQFWMGNQKEQEEYLVSGSGKSPEEREQQGSNNIGGGESRVKVQAPDVNYKYLFSIDGEPLDRFAQLSHDLKIILLSQKRKFTMIQGIDQYLDRAKVLQNREQTVRVLLKNRGNSWFLNNMSDAQQRLDQNRMVYEMQQRLKEQKQFETPKKPKMTPRTMIAVEKERQLVNLAQIDFQKRIGNIGLKGSSQQTQKQAAENAQDNQILKFDLEQSIFAYLQKIHFQRKLKKWQMKNKRGSLIPQESQNNNSPGPSQFPSPKLSLINIQQFPNQKQSAQQSIRSLSQPKQLKYSKHKSTCPSPPNLMISTEPTRKPGTRRITTANSQVQTQKLAATMFQNAMNRPQQHELLLPRKIGFQKLRSQKVKKNSVHMSIDFAQSKIAIQKEIPPIIPTPFNRAAPLQQKNRTQKGWSCSLEKYKRVKMTMREMKALDKLVKASRKSPPDSATALKIIRKTQNMQITQQQQNQAEILKNLNDNRNYQKRGVKFKEIEQFKNEYALSRKDVYAIKSRFMSLEKMSESNQMQTPSTPHNDNAMITQMVSTSDEISKVFSSSNGPGGVSKKGGISLKNFLRTSPLVKDLDPNVALRLIQALGIDPGNSGQKIDWKNYVELYCILKENNTNNKKLSQFWIKYFDPQSLGIIQVNEMVQMLQDLLKGKSQGAHSWIIHHFSSNFIKRLVIENIVDAEKKIVDLFELQKKFQDSGKMVEPGMLSKAAGQHEFQDVFNELELTPEQEKIFNHVMSGSKKQKKFQKDSKKSGGGKVEGGVDGDQNKVAFEEISEKQANNEIQNNQNNEAEEGIESQGSKMVQEDGVSEE